MGSLGEGDVLIGEILGGFGFISNFKPGFVTATAFSPGGLSSSGVTVGPVVPEPSSFILLISAGMLFLKRRR